MSKKHLPVYASIGLAAVFLVGITLLAVMLLKSCREDDVAYWGPMQEATDGTFYKGLPLGGLALSAYLNEEGVPDRNDRILRAYAAGRLSVSQKVYKSTSTTRRFAQAVRLPYAEEEPQPLMPAECGYYNGPCMLVVGEGYSDDSSLRFIPDVSGREGYIPSKFIDDETVLLHGGFGDGPCGSTSYKGMDFVSGSSTHLLSRSRCYGGHPTDTIDTSNPDIVGPSMSIEFFADQKRVIAVGVRSQKMGEDLLEAKSFLIDFVQEGEIIRTLRNVTSSKSYVLDEVLDPFDWIRADVDAYFANPSELRVLIGDSVYTFPVPADTGVSQSPR